MVHLRHGILAHGIFAVFQVSAGVVYVLNVAHVADWFGWTTFTPQLLQE